MRSNKRPMNECNTDVNFARRAGFISFNKSCELLLINRFNAASEKSNESYSCCAQHVWCEFELTNDWISIGNIINTHLNFFNTEIHFSFFDS